MFTPRQLSPLMCHMLRVISHVPRVMCHLSGFKYHIIIFLHKLVEQVGGRSFINEAYPVQLFKSHSKHLVKNGVQRQCFFCKHQFALIYHKIILLFFFYFGAFEIFQTCFWIIIKSFVTVVIHCFRVTKNIVDQYQQIGV